MISEMLYLTKKLTFDFELAIANAARLG